MSPSSIKVLFVTITLSLAFAADPVSAAPSQRRPKPCPAAYSTLMPNMDWRKANTNPNDAGGYTATTKAREAEIKEMAEEMADDVLNSGVAGSMEVFSGQGVKVKTLIDTPGYQSGIITKIQVGGLGPEGKYRGTAVLTVSGHTSQADALRWAKTDKYSLHVQDSTGAQTTVVNNAKSLDVVTLQEFEIPMKKGETVRLLYDRGGSAGPGGYIEGRALDIVWDGT